MYNLRIFNVIFVAFFNIFGVMLPVLRVFVGVSEFCSSVHAMTFCRHSWSMGGLTLPFQLLLGGASINRSDIQESPFSGGAGR